MVLTFRLQPDSAMTNSLANIITEITAAANQADTDELALLRALAEAPDIRSGATSLPAIGTTPEERVVPETLHYSFDMAVNRVNSHTTAKRHAGKAEGGVKTGLLGIGAGIEGELCRDEQHARSTDYRGRIHVAGTLARREISPGARLLRDTALRIAAIEHEALIENVRQSLSGGQPEKEAAD